MVRPLRLTASLAIAFAVFAANAAPFTGLHYTSSRSLRKRRTGRS